MKRAIIINVMTLITFGIMKAAWELATEGQKMHGGKKSEYLGASMRQAWAVKKAGCTEEAAMIAGGYTIEQEVTALAVDAPTAPKLNGKEKADVFAELKRSLNTFLDETTVKQPQPTERDTFLRECLDERRAMEAEAEAEYQAFFKPEPEALTCSVCAKEFTREQLTFSMRKMRGSCIQHQHRACSVCHAKDVAKNRTFQAKKSFSQQQRGTYWNNNSPARVKFLADELDAAFRK